MAYREIIEASKSGMSCFAYFLHIVNLLWYAEKYSKILEIKKLRSCLRYIKLGR